GGFAGTFIGGQQPITEQIGNTLADLAGGGQAQKDYFDYLNTAIQKGGGTAQFGTYMGGYKGTTAGPLGSLNPTEAAKAQIEALRSFHQPGTDEIADAIKDGAALIRDSNG